MRKLILLAILIACFVYFTATADAEENSLTIKDGKIILIKPNLKSYTISFDEPTEFQATEGCVWENKTDHKTYIMTDGVWKNAEATEEIIQALENMAIAIDGMEEGAAKEATKEAKKAIDDKYKDKE